VINQSVHNAVTVYKTAFIVGKRSVEADLCAGYGPLSKRESLIAVIVAATTVVASLPSRDTTSNTTLPSK
jgi:hypothetical protein